MKQLILASLLLVTYCKGQPAEKKCCTSKTVGDVSYTLVSQGAVPPSCLSACIYQSNDDPASRYCFANGDLPVTCGGTCRPGWAGPAKGDIGGEMQGEEACVKVLQNDGNHYTGREACRQECISLGGDLVSIHSARENGLVYGLMNAGQDVRPAWIGVAVCNDTSGCNEFSWTDGSPVPYSNFQSGPPYPAGLCYAMGAMVDGTKSDKWVAVPCEGADRYDCVCLEILW